jgi:single-strand DNA-binding protein
MSVRSLNKVQLIGNLTRDPELRYTPAGTAVCSFGLATNRSWTTDAGEKKEETEFHRLVAWNKLAELCSQLLVKGRKIYVEGRLQTRSWQGQDGAQRQTTEIVIDDMIILDSRRDLESRQNSDEFSTPELATTPVPKPLPAASDTPISSTSTPASDTGGSNQTVPVADKSKKKKSVDSQDNQGQTGQESGQNTQSEDINPDDIPF